MKLSILDKDYVKIKDSFGGCQSWVDKDEKSFLCDGGCGIVSACDLVVYLQGNRELKSRCYPFNNFSPRLEKEDYIKKLKYIEEYYMPTFDVRSGPMLVLGKKLGRGFSDLISNKTGTWGVCHYNYMMGLKRIFKDFFNQDIKLRYSYFLNGKIIENLSAYFTLCVIDSALASKNIAIAIPNKTNLVNNHYALSTNEKEILEDIKISLKRNIPPALMLGLGSRVNFYSDNKLKEVAIKHRGAHWVNIIELDIDSENEKLVLTVSSWGKRFYLDYFEVFKNPGLLGGIVLLEFQEG